MSLTQEQMKNYTAVLHDELIPAMGCTEPIAIAYAAAKAKDLLPEAVERYDVKCSGNIIKNVKGVTVPNSGGRKGILAAAALGIAGGDSSRALEVIASVTDEGRRAAAELEESGKGNVELADGVPGLYIDVTLAGASHSSRVVIAGTHTNIIRMEQDGVVMYEKGMAGAEQSETAQGDPNAMTLKGILEYAAAVDLENIRALLERQITMNSAIAEEGLKNPWGAQVGRVLMQNAGDDVKILAAARAAAGSDARMNGCPMPVVINSGSGNQGITVCMPVVTYAQHWKTSRDELLRALAVGNLVSIYIKHYIGPLSAYCGAVSAACGAGAAITWMASRGDYDHVARTITNHLASISGIVCDGAKSSCAFKIAASVQSAILAHRMSMAGITLGAGEGLVAGDVEQTIKNIGYVGKVGMKETDKEILSVMIGKADVEKAL